MLWDCHDPLLEWIQPDRSQVALQINNTMSPPSTFYTGKQNISQVAQFKAWRGNTTIDVWEGVEQVAGTNSNGQFPPFLTEQSKLHNFNVNCVWMST